MMKTKRGQLIAEPFIWISALVIGALVLFFGIRSVFNLIDTAALTQIADFKKSFETSVNEVYYSDAGSSKLVSISLPGKIKRVCFYSNQGSINKNEISPEDISAIKIAGSDKNMFLLPLDAYKITLMHNIENLKANNLICFDKTKKIKLVSMGDYVGVEKPQTNQ